MISASNVTDRADHQSSDGCQKSILRREDPAAPPWHSESKGPHRSVIDMLLECENDLLGRRCRSGPSQILDSLPGKASPPGSDRII